MGQHKKTIGGFFVIWIARFLYLASISAFIPFGAVLITSPLEVAPKFFDYVPLSALALLTISLVMLFAYYKNTAHVLSTMGWFALIPGIGGAFFMWFQSERIFMFLEKFYGGFDLVEPLVAAVENTFPRLWVLIIGYIILGFMFIHFAGRIEREHSLLDQVRKMFGKRARIVRSR